MLRMTCDGFHVRRSFGLENDLRLQAGLGETGYAHCAIRRCGCNEGVVTGPFNIKNGIAIGLDAWAEVVNAIGTGHRVEHGNDADFVGSSEQARITA